MELAAGVRYGAGGGESVADMLIFTVAVDAPPGQAQAIKEALGIDLEQFGGGLT